MRVDLHALPGVVVVRNDNERITWSAPTIMALKLEVSLALDRGQGWLNSMPLTDEHGKLTTLKEWVRI